MLNSQHFLNRLMVNTIWVSSADLLKLLPSILNLLDLSWCIYRSFDVVFMFIFSSPVLDKCVC